MRIGSLFILSALLLASCQNPKARVTPPSSPSNTTALAPPPVDFEDVTEVSGLRFRHVTGAAGKRYMPETMGAGCAFLDYDNDGWPDILLLNGKDWRPKPGSRHTPALYRNNHNGTFTDVTHQAGLEVELYAMGCAAADYDNDGYTDLFIACVGESRLFHNEHGHFVDVTRKAGIAGSRWSAAAVWLDYDRDGHLDLFVTNYVRWSPETDRYCSLTGKSKSYCTPQDYDGLACALYHNRGDGTFEDVSEQAGIRRVVGKSLGALALDYDHDGWPDLFVANDTERNFLFHNTGKGMFEEVALPLGFALGETGRPRAGMGLAAADSDLSGEATVAVTDFAGEGVGLFARGREGLYTDEAAKRGVRDLTIPYVGFGVCFLDADLDGWPDLLVANGHVHDDIASFQPQQSHAQPVRLFLNREGRFMPSSPSVPAWGRPMVARGLAVADFDRDGRPDVLISANGGSPRLLRNTTPGPHTWLRLTLQGTRSNRSAIGAQVSVRVGHTTQTQWVCAGSSYGSQSELPLTFSLLGRKQADEIVVRWPSGETQHGERLPADTATILVEK